MKATLLIATSNPGKTREIRRLLDAPGLAISCSDLQGINLVPPEETGQTFADNACIKARYYADLSGQPAVADDSGLEVLSLDGFPGVASARWLAGSDTDRLQGLLSMLEERQQTEPSQRRACFTCAVCFAQPHQTAVQTFTGRVWGTLAHQPLGQAGFGYDPIFIPDGYSETFGQLGTSIKNTISHRAQAFAQLKDWLLTQRTSYAGALLQ